jgi:hypothetical protein
MLLLLLRLLLVMLLLMVNRYCFVVDGVVADFVANVIDDVAGVVALLVVARASATLSCVVAEEVCWLCASLTVAIIDLADHRYCAYR